MTTPIQDKSNSTPNKKAVKPAIRIRPQPKSLPTTIQTTIQTPSSSSSSSSSSASSPSNKTNKHIQTQIMIQLFQDHIFIILSQRQGKLGSLYRCTVEHSIIDNTHTYEVTPLLGGAGRRGGGGASSSSSSRKLSSSLPDIGPVYARQILQRIVALDGAAAAAAARDTTPLLLGISLVEGSEGKETFDILVGKVLDMYQDAIRMVSSSSSSSSSSLTSSKVEGERADTST